jgi:hypothetical protein
LASRYGIAMRASWVVVHAALLAVTLRVWHLLLFKEHLDRPVIVAAWLAAGFALLLAAREMALGTAPERRGRLRRAYAAVRGPEVALLALLFVLLFLFHWGFARAASDGREYFVQVRSLIIDRDLDLSNENATFGVRGTAGNYAFGAPLLWAPFFLLAHGWLGLLNLLGGDYPRNGFFNPYQRAIGIGTLVYGFAALWLIHRLLCRYFTRGLASASTIAVTLGSFILWYLVADNSMSHGASMFAVTLFVWTWHETRNDLTARRWALLGATAGLMSMVRWQNVLFVVFPAVEELGNLAGSSREGRRSAPARYGAFIGAFLLAFSPQMFAWRALRGAWFDPPASAHSVAFTAPAIGDVLFAPDRGLFSWTPLLLLAALGLILFARRHFQLGALLIVALALQVYINATVESGGHGFGGRRFANCAVIFAIGLATLLEWLKRRPAVAPALLTLGLIAVNIFFMAGMHAGDVPPSGTVRFRDMVGAATDRLGNPFALPMSALTALRFDTDLGFYERVGSQTFNNLAIDVGGANDQRFLVHGWSGSEAGDGMTFRWSDGPESTLVVPLKEAADYRLSLRGAPFLPEDAGLQVVEIWVNDELADRVAVTPGTRTYTISIGAALLRPKFNEIRLRYAWTASPRSAGLSADDRQLAVQFDRITLTRVN